MAGAWNAGPGGCRKYLACPGELTASCSGDDCELTREQGRAVDVLIHLASAFRLSGRLASLACRGAITTDAIETSTPPSAKEEDDPFSAPTPTGEGEDEPSKDELKDARQHSEAEKFKTKILGGIQWRAGEYLLRIALKEAAVNAQRGSIPEAEYMLNVSGQVAEGVRSTVYASRVAAQRAELLFRRRQFDEAEQKLEEAVELCPLDDGPDMLEIKRVRGDLLVKLRMIKEARQILTTASKDVQGLDAVFVAAEALLPSPGKVGVSTTFPAKASVSSTSRTKEPLLPIALAHILKRQGSSSFSVLLPQR